MFKNYAEIVREGIVIDKKIYGALDFKSVLSEDSYIEMIY